MKNTFKAHWAPVLFIIALVAVIGLVITACSEPKAETPALTGTVSISGAAQVGQTLTANTASLGGNGTISYEWKRDDGTVIGTSSSYTVQNTDIGSTITVTVTRSGYSGSVTSAPTAVITDTSLPALTGTVSISGTAEVGETLTANTSVLGGSGTIFYQWKRGETEIGANGSSYTVQTADVGSTITVTVTRSDNSGSVTSAPTAVVVIAEVSPTQGLSFTKINGNTAWSVSKGTATVAEVVIPAIYEGLPVSAIAGAGFASYTNMTSIEIPDSVTSIGQNAFYNCTGLTSITIPFVGSTLNGTSCFGDIFGATSYNTQNSSVPASLKTVIITGGNSIPANAFYGCANLTSITILNSVLSIGQNAFSGCTGLTDITIPNSVTSIGQSVFSGCTNLVNVTIGNGVTNVPDNMFSGCNNLTSITIPFVGASLDGTYNTHFGYIFGSPAPTDSPPYFYQYEYIPASLKTVIITGGNSIDKYAFRWCTNLTSVTIPDSVISINFSAFDVCTGLTSITVTSGNSVYRSEGNCVIQTIYRNSIDANTLILGCKTSIIPDSVTSIGQNAFFGCSGLTSVTIPDSVTSIGQSAFLGTGLTSVTIPAENTDIKFAAFFDCTGLTSVTFQEKIYIGRFDSNAFGGKSSSGGYWSGGIGNLRDVFYATDSSYGTPGTYTTTAPVDYYSTWTLQN